MREADSYWSWRSKGCEFIHVRSNDPAIPMSSGWLAAHFNDCDDYGSVRVSNYSSCSHPKGMAWPCTRPSLGPSPRWLHCLRHPWWMSRAAGWPKMSLEELTCGAVGGQLGIHGHPWATNPFVTKLWFSCSAGWFSQGQICRIQVPRTAFNQLVMS